MGLSSNNILVAAAVGSGAIGGRGSVTSVCVIFFSVF